MKSAPFGIPAAGSTTSFIGCVATDGSPSGSLGPTREKVAAAPFTFTASIGRSSWKSRLNSERFWVAVAVIVVVAESKPLATGS